MILECIRNFFRTTLKIITGYFYMNMQAYLLTVYGYLFIKRLSISVVPEFFKLRFVRDTVSFKTFYYTVQYG